MSISAQAKKEILKQNCHANFPYFIEITNGDNGEVYRYVNMDESQLYLGNVYEAAAFDIKPFEQTQEKISNGTLTLYDASLNLVPIVRESVEPFTIRFTAAVRYESTSSWSCESIEENQATLGDFSWSNGNEISCTMIFDEDMDISMPCDKFDEVTTPGLY